ncbi:MAG: hypothetical protein U9N50_13020 [Pseudomonadota bacterium]|nr:hypothetical protein [Pseudomonadota bacterium]
MRFTLILLLILMSPLTWSKDYSHLHQRVIYPNRLLLPTNVEKIGNQYFIVDCYNNRVLYSDKIDTPLVEWNRLGTDIPMSWPHSIASDGHFYLVDDTYQNRLLIFKRKDNAFIFHKVINDISKSPHRVLYDDATNAFYLLGAWSQSITKLVHRNDDIEIEYSRKMDFLKGTYSRSIHIIDGLMYFISGPGRINVVRYKDDSYEIVRSHDVPDGFKSMNDIARVGDVFYLTASLGKMLKCKSLDDLASCENVYESLGIKGNPYFFSYFDDAFHLTEIGTGDGVIKFDHDNNGLKNPFYFHRY